MKKTLLLLTLSATLFCKSQASAADEACLLPIKIKEVAFDTTGPVLIDTIHLNITLTGKQHGYLIGFMEDAIKGQPEVYRYIQQIGSQIADTSAAELSKPVTVSVPIGLIRLVYIIMGSKPESLAAEYNKTIKEALFVQLQKSPTTLANLAAVEERNKAARDAIVAAGVSFIFRVKE